MWICIWDFAANPLINVSNFDNIVRVLLLELYNKASNIFCIIHIMPTFSLHCVPVFTRREKFYVDV